MPPTTAMAALPMVSRRRISTRHPHEAINAACLVGHSTLRVGSMTVLDRPAEAAEIGRMGELLQEALDAGAVGMSSGLAYAPAEHAPPAEIEALAALLRPAGALYTTHMRNEGDRVLDSLEESFAVGPRGRGAGGDLAPQDDRAAEFRPHRPNPAGHRRRHRGAGDRARRLPLHRLLDGADRGAGRAGDKGAGDLVEERAGAGRPRTLCDCRGMGGQPEGGGRASLRRPGRSIG